MKKLYLNYDPDLMSINNFLYEFVEESSPATYFNKNCEIIQCFGSRNRSFKDLLKLTKTYFPELKLEQFAYEFIKFLKVNNRHNEPASFAECIKCPDINQVVLVCEFCGGFDAFDQRGWYYLGTYGRHDKSKKKYSTAKLKLFTMNNILKMANDYRKENRLKF